jgi:hypothetical protein
MLQKTPLPAPSIGGSAASPWAFLSPQGPAMSLGFFDLAIAAPSMKAALKVWGADSNLFHQGVAKQTDDHEVVAATMASRALC